MGKIGMWCGWLAAVAALAWGQQTAVGGEDGRGAGAAELLAQRTAAVTNDEHVALQSENLALKMRAAELEAALYRLEEKAAQAGQETARYRAGLARAVAALNRRGVASSSAPPPRVRRSRRSGGSSAKSPLRRGSGRIRGKTRLQVLGDDILVSATLKNSRAQAVSGTLTIELMRDGRVVDTADTLLALPPRGKGHHQHRFTVSGFNAETYTARAFLEP